MIAVVKRSELLLLVYGERVNSIKPSLASVRKGWAVRLRASLWAETLPLDHRLVNSKILLILDRWTIRLHGSGKVPKYFSIDHFRRIIFLAQHENCFDRNIRKHSQIKQSILHLVT